MCVNKPTELNFFYLNREKKSGIAIQNTVVRGIHEEDSQENRNDSFYRLTFETFVSILLQGQPDPQNAIHWENTTFFYIRRSRLIALPSRPPMTRPKEPVL